MVNFGPYRSKKRPAGRLIACEERRKGKKEERKMKER